MKRLFSRRDKAPVVAVTPPIGDSIEQNGTPSSNPNDLLLTPTLQAAATTRRKPSFFDFSSVAVARAGSIIRSQSSDASSVPLTAGSISGCSDASSSMLSTPTEDSTMLNSARTVSEVTITKTWPSWIGSISKASFQKSKLQAVSSIANVSRIGSGNVNHIRPLNSTTSVPSSNSDDSGDSSWDDEEEEEEGINQGSKQKRRPKLRGRKTMHAPGQAGGRQLSPHGRQIHSRSIFGAHSVSAPISRETSKALANLHALTLDALVPPSSAPPLVSTASSVPFPRSSNRLHYAHSISSALHSPLHVEILRKRLLRRIERRQLSLAEQESIQTLTTRSARPRNADKRKLPSAEETYEDSKAVGGGWSKGMKRWAMRPCFEERMVIWKPVDDKIVVVPVERDSRAAVSALDFSEGAEALAGLHRQNELPPPPSDIYVPASSRKLPPPLVIPRSQTGIGANKPSTFLNTSLNRSRLGPSRLRSPVDISLLQSSQDEDDLPLGVVMIQRRQKEEAEERRKRALQEIADRERRAREEEEKRKRYQEEILAARNRREVEKAGILAAKAKDAWLNGEADALPPPVKPSATHNVKSSSNPNLASPVLPAGLQAPNKPFVQRRMTSDSSATSSTATTTKPQETTKQPSTSATPSPWSGLPSGSSMNGLYNSSQPGIPHSNSFPRMPMPMSGPPTQTGMNYGMMMMPPMPDPVSMAILEQRFLRPWAMDSMNGRGSPNGSNEMLTPPRLPFSMGFGSSGDSSGSLTPPKFPNSRPSSLGSSNEDIRLTPGNGVGSGPRPISIGSGSGDSYEWRRSRSSMFIPAGDDKQSRSLSRSPQEQAMSLMPSKAGHQRVNTSTSIGTMAKSNRSEKSEAPSSFSRHPLSRTNTSTKPDDGGGGKTASHRSSSNNLKSTSSNNLHTTSSSGNLRSSSQPRSRTVPAPNVPPKNPYGLPTSQSYGPSSGSSLRDSASTGTVSASARQRPPIHAHSKSAGQPTRKSRLFS